MEAKANNEYKLYDQLQNPVMVLNRDLEVVYFNFVCGAYFKMPPRKLANGVSLTELVRCREIDLATIATEALADGASKFTQEFIAEVGQAEQEAAVILKFIPLGDDALAVHLLDYSIERQLHDKYKKQIMELRETHDQILRSDKLTALGEMIAGISHEIATPLTIVSDRLARMQSTLNAGDLGESKNVLHELQSGFRRIGEIISGMQSYARNQEEELRPCDLREVIRKSEAFARELGLLEGIQLEISDSGSFLVLANPLKLQQVIINLLKNAVESHRDGNSTDKRVWIELEENELEQSHILRVRDNGPGIEPEKREKIFDMFYTSKGVGEGTGLGLNISQKIIQAHNGTIRLAEGSGEGCEFEIALPVIEAGSYTHTNRYLRGESDSEDEKILVVGKNAEVLGTAYNVLKKLNKVCILSAKEEGLPELAEFFGVDRIASLESRDYSQVEAPVEDLSELEPDEIAEYLEKMAAQS